MLTAEEYAARVINGLENAILEHQGDPIAQLTAVCDSWSKTQFQAEQELVTWQ